MDDPIRRLMLMPLNQLTINVGRFLLFSAARYVKKRITEGNNLQ